MIRAPLALSLDFGYSSFFLFTCSSLSSLSSSSSLEQKGWMNEWMNGRVEQNSVLYILNSRLCIVHWRCWSRIISFHHFAQATWWWCVQNMMKIEQNRCRYMQIPEYSKQPNSRTTNWLIQHSPSFLTNIYIPINFNIYKI